MWENAITMTGDRGSDAVAPGASRSGRTLHYDDGVGVHLDLKAWRKGDHRGVRFGLRWDVVEIEASVGLLGRTVQGFEMLALQRP